MKKHQPYRKNNGFWSCSVCRWEFQTRPNKDNCPGILRIAHATSEYKTRKQWRKLGYEPIPTDELGDRPYDAISIVHSTDWHGYYHRDHVRGLTITQADGRDESVSDDMPFGGWKPNDADLDAIPPAA